MTEQIHVKNREIVIPGDLLAEGINFLPSGKSIREKEGIYATALGLTSIKGRVIKVIPLAGRYTPKKGDSVIGEITGINKYGWKVNINCPFDAELNIADATSTYIDINRTSLSEYFNIGEYVLAGILEITNSGYVKLTTKNRPYRKLNKGVVISVSPTKIPRIIGKHGSMIKILKDMSKCDIVVGQNGLVWVKGLPKKEMCVIAAIKKIEKESHTSGLTDKVKALLKGEMIK